MHEDCADARRTRISLLLVLLLALARCAGGGDAGPSGDTAADAVAPVDTPASDVSAPEDGSPPRDGATPDDSTQPADVPPDAASDVGADTTPDAASDVPEDAAPVDPNDPGPRPPHVRAEGPAASGALHAGVGVGFVTGPVGVSMAGYGGRSDGPSTAWSSLLKGSQGFYGYQTVKAIALEVDGERLVLMKLPTMSSESALTDGMVARLQEKYGIDLTGRILTGATHSHHTNARYWRLPPALGVVGIDSIDEEIVARLVEEFTDTVKRALDDLGPAEWGYAWQDDWDPNDDIYADRRHDNDPLYPKDPRLTLLAVRRPDGTPMATIINFGMHGTSYGKENDLLSEDAPGAIELKFEERFFAATGQPMLGLFVQSGGGDATPTGGHLGHPTAQKIELIGEEAAPRIQALYDTIDWRSDATLAVRSRRIDLRYKWMGYEEFPEFTYPGGRPYYWGAWQCTSPEVEPGESMEGHAKSCTDLKALITSLGGSVPNGEVHQLYLSVARLGPLFLVTIPGEPAYSVIKYVREQMATRDDDGAPLDILVFGYSQDHLLYFTHPDDWFLGGYESEMSLWGPLAGKYVVDRQMELVDDLLGGYTRPAFYEESPNLSPPTPYTPRGFERSVDPGAVVIEVEAAYERTEDVRFGWGGGDPSVSSPHVVLEGQQPDGSFAAVPAPSGWPGADFDNSRYHMITHYAPIPPANAAIRPERSHHWHVDFEVPADLPANTYRLRATGTYWDGADVQDYEVASAPFAVAQTAGATLAATRPEDDRLVLRLTLPPTTFALEPGESWALTGWRLFDALVGPREPITVRVPLAVTLDVDGVPRPDVLAAPWDGEAGANVLDLTGLDVPSGAAVTVSAWLASDTVPSVVAALVAP